MDLIIARPFGKLLHMQQLHRKSLLIHGPTPISLEDLSFYSLASNIRSVSQMID